MRRTEPDFVNPYALSSLRGLEAKSWLILVVHFYLLLSLELRALRLLLLKF